MTVLCAWCGNEIPATETDPGPLISHGICVSCRRRFFAGDLDEFDQFLDSLLVPVLIVDGTGTVLYANAWGRAMLKKDLPAIRGFKGGDVFECVNARLPGGCGNTLRCRECTIRNMVMHTYATGESHERVPAELTRIHDGSAMPVKTLISTEKAKDMVLLRIDKMEPA